MRKLLAALVLGITLVFVAGAVAPARADAGPCLFPDDPGYCI